jgi:hypothetical protein
VVGRPAGHEVRPEMVSGDADGDSECVKLGHRRGYKGVLWSKGSDRTYGLIYLCFLAFDCTSLYTCVLVN